MFDYHAAARAAVSMPSTPASTNTNGFNEHDLELPTRPSASSERYSRARSMGGQRHHRNTPFIIGVAGGTASGKTTVCDMIMQRLHDSCAVLINQDSFYRPLTEEERANVSSFNFDHPDAFDLPTLLQCIQDLKEGKAVHIPCYDFATHSRSCETRRVEPSDVVVIEGILVLHMAEIRSLLNMKIFVDTDDDLRLARRIQRDVTHRGRDVAGVLEQYTRFVKPAFDQFVAPSRRHADIIIPWHCSGGKEPNLVAIDLITEHIRTKLRQPELRRFFPNLEVIPSNFQIQGMHTIIRNRDTPKNDFVFYADRLNRLVVEAGLGHLPFSEQVVITPTGKEYVGVRFASKLCGVSIIRSGEALEAALRDCCKGIKIGKLLVHRHTDDSDIIYEKLPSDIAERHVMLLDPLLSTGHTAVKAIQIIKDRGVPEDRIMMLTIIAAPEGIRKVCGMFPGVRLITSEIDEGVDDDYYIVPGLGNFGDRYFCE